jgi:hypothetical protein
LGLEELGACRSSCRARLSIKKTYDVFHHRLWIKEPRACQHASACGVSSSAVRSVSSYRLPKNSPGRRMYLRTPLGEAWPSAGLWRRVSCWPARMPHALPRDPPLQSRHSVCLLVRVARETTALCRGSNRGSRRFVFMCVAHAHVSFSVPGLDDGVAAPLLLSHVQAYDFRVSS